MLLLELAILIACIAIGARVGGVRLGAVSGIGFPIFVFLLRMPPGSPPTASTTFSSLQRACFGEILVPSTATALALSPLLVK